MTEGSTPRPRWVRWRSVPVVIAVVALVGVANLDVTTQQGVNFEVSTHRLPLYAKALQFVDRSAQYAQIAEEVTAGAASDAERAVRVFAWTKRQIRPTEAGWPIVDDHILHIIIRGHGITDQQADVFATLCTYAGVPAFWAKVRPAAGAPGVILSFARVDGRWRVFDVFNDVVFRTAAGQLATLEDVAGQPDLVPEPARSRDVAGLRYADLVTRVSMPAVPDPLRAELQMPAARLWHEMKRAARIESSE